MSFCMILHVLRVEATTNFALDYLSKRLVETTALGDRGCASSRVKGSFTHCPL